MNINLSYVNRFPKETWGSTFHEITHTADTENIFVCHTNISDLEKMAVELSTKVIDQSWISDLDDRARRAYTSTAQKTAESLIKVFQDNILKENKVSSEFGELMVSMGSSKALEVIFNHRSIPISELWKPKVLQNEGFDFHTVCSKNIINFGEAKFSSSSNPYGGSSDSATGAGGQADRFIFNEKHLMDGIHLGYLAGNDATENLDNDLFGVILAFSINSKDPLTILRNALTNSKTYDNLKKAKNIYIVGVSYDLKGN